MGLQRVTFVHHLFEAENWLCFATTLLVYLHSVLHSRRTDGWIWYGGVVLCVSFAVPSATEMSQCRSHSNMEWVM